MASIRNRNGKYQAQVRRYPHPPITATFLTKTDAKAWARKIETQMDKGEIVQSVSADLLLSDLIARYLKDITPAKKGRVQEAGRLNRLLRDPISCLRVIDLTPSIFAQFRDRRLPQGNRAARYDLVLLQHILKLAKLEWGIPVKSNPLDYVKKPAPSKPRERRLSHDEYDALKHALSGTRSTYLSPLIDLAIQTGMRKGELLKARWDDLDLEGKFLKLHDTKNGEDRSVPLTSHAVTILETWASNDQRIFPVTPVAVRQSWDRLIKRAGITNLHFHDLRHEAISRFFEMGLSIPEVALISGHRDPRMLFRYTHLRAEDVVKKLL